MAHPDPADDEAPLRVVVDLNRCQGYAQCCYAAPDAFELRGHEILFYDPAPPRRAAGRDRAGGPGLPGPRHQPPGRG